MDTLRLLTWNVAGLHEERLDERSEAQCLAALLRPVPFDAIALQEVVRRSWHGHWRHHLAAAGYRVVPADPTTTASEYFALLAVRAELGPVGDAAPFRGSRMGRALVWADFRGWRVLTSHLESERAGRRERVHQAGAALARLRAHGGPAVFAGDANLRVEEEAEVEGLADVDDAWVLAGSPESSRATWIGGRGARFDRVWCSRGLAVASFETLGDRALSDHLGLAVTFRRTPTTPDPLPRGDRPHRV